MTPAHIHPSRFNARTAIPLPRETNLLPVILPDSPCLAKAYKRARRCPALWPRERLRWRHVDRKSTRLNSSHLGISYAVFCLKKKNIVPMNFVRVDFSGTQSAALSRLRCYFARTLYTSPHAHPNIEPSLFFN